MYSTCVIYHHNFNATEWTAADFDSLRLLYFKFDFFVFDPSDPSPDFSDWLKSSILLRRVVVQMETDAKVKNFSCLSRPQNEWVGNIDIFVNFPEDFCAAVEKIIPHRTFLNLKDVLNPETR